MIIPVILSGGSGSRLWPLSTVKKPKQFLSLYNNKTLFSHTLDRFINYGCKKFIVSTNEKYTNLVKDELTSNNVNDYLILSEPESKNTAPSIFSVISYFYNNNMKDETIIITPSDAFINNNNIFYHYISEGERYLKSINKILCFGVKPNYPEEGYGYIKLGKNISNNCFEVEKFCEKPNAESALHFVMDGGYLWNMGVIMGKVSNLYNIFNKYNSKLYNDINDIILNSVCSNNVVKLNKISYSKLKNISIDYDVIEKLTVDELSVVQSLIAWNDIGSYKTLFDLNTKDTNNNVINGNIILNNVNNSFISSDNKNLTIACSDVEDLIIINDNNHLLIANKNKSQNIKQLYNKAIYL